MFSAAIDQTIRVADKQKHRNADAGHRSSVPAPTLVPVPEYRVSTEAFAQTNRMHWEKSSLAGVAGRG